MLTFNFAPFPTLGTKRLTLRQLTSADAQALFTLRADPRVMKYIPRPLAASVADAAALIEQGNAAMSRNELIN